MVINVDDVNDNTPLFSGNNNLNITVPENQPSGLFVSTIKASDHDIGKNGQVKYILEEGCKYF